MINYVSNYQFTVCVILIRHLSFPRKRRFSRFYFKFQLPLFRALEWGIKLASSLADTKVAEGQRWRINCKYHEILQKNFQKFGQILREPILMTLINRFWRRLLIQTRMSNLSSKYRLELSVLKNTFCLCEYSFYISLGHHHWDFDPSQK